MSDHSILCYCATVKKQFQTETLTQALKHLVHYNEMLQMRLENGMYIPEPETIEEQNKLLSVYDGAGKLPAEIETLSRLIVKKLSGEMGCKRGASIRAALLRLDQDRDSIFLLSHRAMVDQKGLVLIFEDLYRIYEQLSNGKEVALRPVRKAYPEFIKEFTAVKRTELDGLIYKSQFPPELSQSIISDTLYGTEADRPKTATFSVTISKILKRRLFSWRLAEFNLTPEEALTGALLRSLVKASKEVSATIYVKSDYRFADETLKHTVSALTQSYILPSHFKEEHALFSEVKKLKGLLRDIPLLSLAQNSTRSASQFSEGANTGLQLRLNLEYLTADPWLGGDEWSPDGFIMTEKGELTGGDSAEIMPFFLRDEIEILVGYKDMPEARALVESFAANLIPELEVILRYCEEYVEAKDFWIREFAKVSAQTKMRVVSDARGVTDGGRASLTCKIERSVMDRALLSFEVDEAALLLAAYSVLVSRLNWREVVVLLCAIDKDGANTAFPLRLNPTWTTSFKLFVEEVRGRFREAAALGPYAFDIFDEERSKHGWPVPALDIGCVFIQTSAKKKVETPANGWLAAQPAFDQYADLVLEIHGHDDDLDLRFVYEKSRFDSETVKLFEVYLNAILDDAVADANVKLGNIEFERDRKAYDQVSSLAKDDFTF